MDFENLKQKINETLKKDEIFVDSINYYKKGKYYFLDIILDKVGGIDLDTIVEATKKVDPIVNEECKSLDNSFILDISSKERG